MNGNLNGSSRRPPRLVHFPLVLFSAALLAGLMSQRLALSQEYMFTTLAGSGGPGAIDGPAVEARFNNPRGVAADAAGNIYVADSFNATIRKIRSDGMVTTLAGLAPSRGAEDGTGSAARFDLPAALVLDAPGNIYAADQNNHVIRKIAPDGLVTAFAGSAGRPGGGDGAGSAAQFNFPSGLAIDRSGNLYVADTSNHTIRKITAAGVVSTLAGSAGLSGSDDGIGAAARFRNPRGLAVGNGAILYVADTGNQTIRAISPGGEVTTLAGSTGLPASFDGAGSSAGFNDPASLATDTFGNLYVADSLNSTVRKVTPDGVVTTLAGDPAPPDPSGRPFISYHDGVGNAARFKNPQGVAVDNLGNIYVADSGNDAIRRITSEGLVSTLAGSSQTGSNDGPGNTARFRHPTGVTVDKTGSVFVVDGDNNTIRLITPNGLVRTIAGLAGAAGNVDEIGLAARFTGPRKLALNRLGNLFVADTANSTVRKLTRSALSSADKWEVSTFAGQPGNPGFSDGSGSEARFNALYDVAIDSYDNLYVADKDNQVIRKVTSAGVVTTFAGTAGSAGATDGPREQAQFNLPYGLAVDRSGIIYVADTLNHAIRKITPDGMVTTLAGMAGALGSDDGLGSLARFTAPYGVAADGGGNVYVADYFNNLIRKITPAGLVTTIGGSFELDPEAFPLNGSADGAGSAARFNKPKGIAVDSAGTVYVADSFNNTIRIGTTDFCPDQATIDQPVAKVGEQRQLDTSPRTAVAWEWKLIRRPANSRAALSAVSVRNPTFTPDVADTFIFQVRATNALGNACLRTVSLTAAKSFPNIITSSLAATNGEFGFTFQSEPGAFVQIQVSADLSHWLSIGTFKNETGTFSIVDQSPAPLRAFYRLRQL